MNHPLQLRVEKLEVEKITDGEYLTTVHFEGLSEVAKVPSCDDPNSHPALIKLTEEMGSQWMARLITVKAGFEGEEAVRCINTLLYGDEHA